MVGGVVSLRAWLGGIGCAAQDGMIWEERAGKKKKQENKNSTSVGVSVSSVELNGKTFSLPPWSSSESLKNMAKKFCIKKYKEIGILFESIESSCIQLIIDKLQKDGTT